MREVEGTVRCGGDTVAHRVRVDADGTVTTLEHDPTAEEVVVALGAEMPTCMRVRKAFADPTAVTLPRDPRFVAYCAHTGHLSVDAVAQIRAWIAAVTRAGAEWGGQREEGLLQHALLQADDALRRRWLLAWLDAHERSDEPRRFQATADFLAHRIYGQGRPGVSWKAGTHPSITQRADGTWVVTVGFDMLRTAVTALGDRTSAFLRV